MAFFLGTRAEFHNHIGPRIRNVANAIARKERNARNGLCQHCQTRVKELDSAHIHGRGRRQIIENILKGFVNSKSEVICDLEQVERMIISAHLPIAENFLFLCKPCHRDYDRHQQRSPDTAQVLYQSENAPKLQSNALPITLHPEDPAEFKRLLLQYKRAILRTHFADGHTEEKVWSAEKFSQTSNVLGNLRSRQEYRADEWQKRGIVSIDVLVKGS